MMHFLRAPTFLLRATELLTAHCHDTDLVTILNHYGRWFKCLLGRLLILSVLQRRFRHKLPCCHCYLLGSIIHLIFRYLEDLVWDALELVHLRQVIANAHLNLVPVGTVLQHLFLSLSVHLFLQGVNLLISLLDQCLDVK